MKNYLITKINGNFEKLNFSRWSEQKSKMRLMLNGDQSAEFLVEGITKIGQKKVENELKKLDQLYSVFDFYGEKIKVKREQVRLLATMYGKKINLITS